MEELWYFILEKIKSKRYFVNIQRILSFYFHRQTNSVNDDCSKYGVLKTGRRNKPPNLVLNNILGYVLFERFSFERILNTLSLILIQITVFVLVLSFVLKGNDHKTNEDVYHEESNDYNVGNKKYSNSSTIIVNGSFVFLCRVYCFVQKSVFLFIFKWIRRFKDAKLIYLKFEKTTYAGHPSKVVTVNRVSMPIKTLSKLNL